ncbi:MAG: DEAD/DEAH box helicase [Anaerobacillus sp.]
MDGTEHDHSYENGSKSMRFASQVVNDRVIYTPESLVISPHSTSFFPISHFISFPFQPRNVTYQPDDQLIQFIHGRHLLCDEIPYPFAILHEHYLNGYLHMEAGIQFVDGKSTCIRCGSSDSFSFFSCARCQRRDCSYCRNCIVMGKVSSCSPLYSVPIHTPEVLPSFSLFWNGTLSSGQLEASNAVKSAIVNHRSLLVWAVCGSGKTEVLFEGLEEAVLQNKTICIATPRTDVVLELTPRLQQVFPNLILSSLYAGHSHPTSRFVISTTHQLIRFKDHFDVMIIDEVDAFPFNHDPSLLYAVEKARKDHSSLVYLTATPSPSMLKQISRQELAYVRIPARFHGFPLPVPSFNWIGNWRKEIKKERLPNVFLKWIKEQVRATKPVLLFLPSIKIIEKVKILLLQEDIFCEAVHSEDQERTEKVLRFRRKELPVLLSSTILERGITIENISVGVIGAEDDIFSESALVQIAGRAGRSSAFPDGDVRFFHFGRTKAMVSSVHHIRQMNKEAEEKGWLFQRSVSGVEKM